MKTLRIYGRRILIGLAITCIFFLTIIIVVSISEMDFWLFFSPFTLILVGLSGVAISGSSLIRQHQLDRYPLEVKLEDMGVTKSEDFWKGFDMACDMLDDLGYSKTSNHEYNIADCLKAKVNRLPKDKVRKNEKAK